jgi:HD-like signal output (HDOD) protein
LHDIGRYILYTHCGAQSIRAIRRASREDRALHEAEQEIFAFDHAEAGQALLELWGLPPCHQEAVGCHHAPERAERYPVEAAILHVADFMTSALEAGGHNMAPVPALSLARWKYLGIGEDSIPRICDEAIARFEDARLILLEDAV